MAKRSREPEEAFGPMLDGTEEIASLARHLEKPAAETPAEESLPVPEEPQVALICGSGEVALAVARLAAECGFLVELAVAAAPESGDELAELAQVRHILLDDDDFVAACDIDRNHYVCIFDENAENCRHILSQCMPSDAAYLGVDADAGLAAEIISGLKAAGAPDAELAAICCPMGLNIGACGASQKAVAIVAELLAARSGVLKRLRFAD